jgi:hypothetical protein
VEGSAVCDLCLVAHNVSQATNGGAHGGGRRRVHDVSAARDGLLARTARPNASCNATNRLFIPQRRVSGGGKKPKYDDEKKKKKREKNHLFFVSARVVRVRYEFATEVALVLGTLRDLHLLRLLTQRRTDNKREKKAKKKQKKMIFLSFFWSFG